MKGLLTIMTVLTLYSCQYQGPQENLLASDINESSQDQKSETLFKKNFPFEVVTVRKSVDYPSSEKDTTLCHAWTLSKVEIQKIIKDSDPITGNDWHHLFDHLPCIISGQLKQNGATFNYVINGGSWLTIDLGDTTIILGNFKTENEHFFLSDAWAK